MLGLSGNDRGRALGFQPHHQRLPLVKVNEELTFFVHPRLIGARSPFGGEGFAFGRQGGGNRQIRLRLEVLHGVVTAGHHRQRRRLHAAHGNEFAFAVRRLVRQRVGAGKIHSKQPVCSGAAAGSITHSGEGFVRLEVLQPLADGGRIDSRHPEAFYGLAAFEVLNHLVYEELSFAIRVAGIDETVGGLDEFPDGGQLFFDAGVGLRVRFPFSWEDRQVFHAPDLFAFLGFRHVVRKVVVRFGLFQKVPKAPCHCAAVSAFDAAPGFVGNAEFGRNGFGDGRFFGNE